MPYARYIPSAPLNAYILYLYYLDGPAPYPRQKVLPMPSINAMLNLGDPFRVYAPEQVEPLAICAESWWVGLWNQYHTVDWPQTVRFFGILFKPGGAYPFLQLPLSELSSQVVPLDAIWGNFAVELRERLASVPSIQAGFQLLETLLLKRLYSRQGIYAPHGLDVVQHALSEIARRGGSMSIEALSEQIGISQNHLGTQFKRMVGVPPKELARFYRFSDVLRLIDTAPAVDWTRIAQEAGYYDQPHFNKDFLAFTGHTPTDYLRLRRLVLDENREFGLNNSNNLPVD